MGGWMSKWKEGINGAVDGWMEKWTRGQDDG